MRRRTLLATALAGAFIPPARAQQAALLPVLTYHRFSPGASTSATIVSTPVFASQMAWLAAHHVAVVPLRDTLGVAHGEAVAEPGVSITADDGWRSVYTEMFPILMRHKFPVTLFINPPAIGQGGAYLTWAMIGEMIKSGLVDVQPHTQSHPNFNTEREHRDASGFRDFVAREISASRAAIIAHLGLPADMLAWPFGIHDAELEKAAAGAGCVAAFALGSHPVVNGDPDFALPRYQIYDTDRASRFGWIVAGNPRKPLAKKVSA